MREAAAEAREATADEPAYALVIEKRGGGLAIVEVEVPRSATRTVREHAPDAVDQTIARLVGIIERRFLR